MQDIKLYIGGMPVDLSDNVDVLFTYAADDMTNPTIVRNSYSKTIVIEDSPNNSKVFGQFWNLERTQDYSGQYGISYNPSKRVPFTLYANSEIYQSGYCKLLNVKKTGKNNTYELTLFGGLGSFFFNLAYLDDDTTDNNKRKLSDLHFMTWDSSTPSEKEFDFTIKQQTIQEAWNNVEASDSSKWHYINFADTYDGYPDDFDTDKVLMYMGTSGSTASTSNENSGGTTRVSGTVRPGGGSGGNSNPTTTSTTEGTYATYDGYVLAEMPKERTAQQMREFRSYLMRPVLRVKEVINACCAPENNGGFTVDLDETFFNEHNPYWENAWMTLPLLSSMDFSNVEGDEQTGVTATVGAMSSGGTKSGETYTETREIVIGEISASSNFNFSMDLNVEALLNALPSGYKTVDSDIVYNGNYPQSMSPQAIYPCAYSVKTDTYYPGTICIQLVAYSRDGKPINGSPVYNCTSGYNPYRASSSRRGSGGGTATVYVPSPNDFKSFTPAYGTEYVNKSGQFNYVSGSTSSTSTWQMEDTLNFRLNKLPKTCVLKLIITKLNGCEQASSTKAMSLYQRYYTDYTTEQREGRTYLTSSFTTAYRNPATINHFNLKLSNVDVSLVSEEGIRTGAKFTKADLLNTDYSPADFLLSYAKLFGLYFEKDKYDDTIYIRTRDTFYNKENVIDISDKIDHSKDIKITPMVFDAKWYDWSLKQEKSLFGDQYQGTYGVPFEIQRVNTGYNFDSSQKDLYKDNIFKGGVEALEKSDMFGYISADTTTKPWMLDGYTYKLYATDDMQATTDITIQPQPKKGVIKSYSDNPQYDLYSKPQFHGDDENASDGGNVLLFYVGSVPTKTKNTGSDLNYYITDDNTYMNTLNDGNACWLYTNSETDAGGIRIATKITSIPHFSRYRANDATGVIMQSWGFGVPKQLYIPGYSMDYSSTIYDNYWKSYITDMYDIDTKKLSCFIKMDERPTEEWLRDFYWFDNSIWRINKIIEANPVNKDTTNVELIKVQDRYNYSNVNVSTIPRIDIRPSTNAVTEAGGVVTINVSVSDGGYWYVSDVVMDRYNPSASSGYGSTTFTVTIPANDSTEAIVHNIAVQNDYGVWAQCNITQQKTVLSVTPFAQYTYSDIPWTGGTQMYDVRSTYPWIVTNVDNRSYVTLDPMSGQGGQYANHFECTFEQSDSLAPRSVKMRFTNSLGSYVDVWKWQEACKQIVYDATGGTQNYTFLSGSTAVMPDWLDITESSTGNYAITAKENTGLSERSTSVIMTDTLGNTTMFEVVQQSDSVLDVVRVDGTGNVLADGGNIVLQITSNGAWTASSDSNWAVLNTTQATTSATIVVTVHQNFDDVRQALLTFTNENGSVVYFTLVQEGDYAGSSYLTPSTKEMTSAGGTYGITITTNHSWIVTDYPAFVSLSQTAGTNSSSVIVTVSANDSDMRTGSIVFNDTNTGKNYASTLVQLGTASTPSLLCEPNPINAIVQGGSYPITLAYQFRGDDVPTATTSDNHISISDITWNGDIGSAVVYVNENQTTTAYTGTISFVGLQSTTLTINQPGAEPYLRVSPASINFYQTGGTATITINTNTDWTIS